MSSDADAHCLQAAFLIAFWWGACSKSKERLQTTRERGNAHGHRDSRTNEWGVSEGKMGENIERNAVTILG